MSELFFSQTRRASNWGVPRVTITYEALLKEKNILKNYGSGTGAGREARNAAWDRVLGEFIMMNYKIFLFNDKEVWTLFLMHFN